MSIDEYIAGFHSRLDNISDLALDDKLKGHLLFRQAALDSSARSHCWHISPQLRNIQYFGFLATNIARQG